MAGNYKEQDFEEHKEQNCVGMLQMEETGGIIDDNN